VGHASGRVILARFLLGARRYLHAQIDIADPEWGKAAIDSHHRLIAALRSRDTAAASRSQVGLPETSTGGRDFNPVASRRGNSTSARPALFHQQPHAEIAGRQEKTIGVGQLRSDTLGYFDRVAAGETIDVVRRGKVAARIVPDMRESRLAGDAPGSAGSAKRSITTRVALDDLRTLAGRYLDRVAAGETLEIIHGGEIVARVIRPEGS
jgi:antitoxin (DNA-binding transcriptional repressor) of toxin-antitoxin stability system